MMARSRLPKKFYMRSTLEVAGDLLGRVLCRRLPDGEVLRGRLLEVEAYDGPGDLASHASRGMTPRNAPMFEAGGIAYVYLVYGIHNCLNIVTGEKGYPAAILLRGVESPGDGLSASGPGRLGRAFEIDRSLSGISFVGNTLWLEAGEPPPRRKVTRTARVGVDYAGAWAKKKCRFVI
jgi:DNA-3-methyladenine glycosylase